MGASTSDHPLGPWIRYKRMVDNFPLSARLVMRGDKKMLEVKEKRMGDFHCPNCKYLLTQQSTGQFPNFYLEPKKFHAAHRLVDPCP